VSVADPAPGPAVGGRIPFRIAIVTLVVGLLVVTCGVLIGYVLHRGQRSVETLKGAYLEQVLDTAVREVARLPRAASQILRVQRVRLERGDYPTDDAIALARILGGELQADPDIQWVSYGEDATGRFMGATRLDGDTVLLNVSDPRDNRGVPREFRSDTLAPHLRTPPLTEPYDPRTRPWYERALAHPATVIWMPPYVFAEGVMGITAALDVRDRTGRVQGVLTVDFGLRGVARFLQTIRLERGGVVLVFDKGGTLVAGAPGPGRDAAGRAVQRWTEEGPADAVGIRHAETVIGAERWDVAARPLARGAGPEWTVAVAVPNEAFMGPVHANRRAAIVIALVGLALAVVAGTLLSTGIARSLAGATRELDRIARFELAPPAPARSALREVAQLQRAVGRVTASLRSFARYAPEEIVREVVVSGREAMLSGEKREVTVFFSDLRGFTHFAERTRPEEVVAILNDHFELVVATIARHGGFVVDFLGDSVFAVFGAPRADRDHVEHAVACAVEMQRARTDRNVAMRERGWPPLEMGVGINVGPAVVGNMGAHRRIKYGVVGHVVNVAARIETFTVGGQVLVSDAVRDALGDRLVADGPLEAEGKGVGATMRLWEVLALRGDRMLTLPSPVRDLAVLEPPLQARLRLVLGKQIDSRVYGARLHGLGAGGAEIESDAPLVVFAAVQILLPVPAAEAEADALTVDAKVVQVSGEASSRRALARFTGVDWETRARIEALAGQPPRQPRQPQQPSIPGSPVPESPSVPGRA
jgi:adenylate cyclase